MAIKTPDILPGEKGYVPKREKTALRKAAAKKAKTIQRKKDKIIGKIKTGSKGYRIGQKISNLEVLKKNRRNPNRPIRRNRANL